MDNKITLPLIGNKILIFNLDDIKKLRNLGILGILIGTLSKFPQQNLFLSKPLELSFHEALWLIEFGYGIIIDNFKFNNNILLFNKDRRTNLIDDKLITFDVQSIENFPDEERNELINTSKVSVNQYIKSNYTSMSQLHKLIKTYKIFKFFKSLDYFMLPGLKFGGQLICYPGDPLRYHSHLIVSINEEVEINSLIVGGRLATGVKKVWVLIGDSNESGQIENIDDSVLLNEFTKEYNMSSFSIEWAGFG